MKASDINPDYLRKRGIEVPKVRRQNKYGAVRTTYNGREYPSALEANTRAQLDRMQTAGLVTSIREQVKFDLPADISYVADFLVTYAVGEPRVIDAKGLKLAVFRMKAKLFKEKYGYAIDVVESWKDIPTEGRKT